jgi:archaeosine-15-forming tRNA-guanine transglycosylase
MPATIEYEVDGETHSITRQEYHMDVDGYVTAYTQNGTEITRKVKIPEHRVVMIYETDS